LAFNSILLSCFLQSKNSLRNATIQAMSNLLSANIDSGLMHSIGLGYHKDLQTRFTVVFVTLCQKRVKDKIKKHFVFSVEQGFFVLHN
jgi:hypothetical protein